MHAVLPVPNPLPWRCTKYVYDADGKRLLARTPTGTTFYWGEHTEVTLEAGASTPTATRYIPLGGGHQAVLDNDGTWTITLADHHNTAQLAVDAASLELTQRRTLPFGALRGTEPEPWPTSRGFLGGTDETDTTGLAHLGAREYDPATYSDPDGLKYLALDGLGHGIVPKADGSGMRISGKVHYPTDDGNEDSGSSGAGCDAECRTTLNIFQCGAPNCGKPKFISEADWDAWKQQQYEPTPWYFEVAYELSGIPDFLECYDNPGLASCGMLAASVTPLGKAAKGLKISDKALDRYRKARRAADKCHSFVPGTDVLLADGTHKNIEDVEIGDKVVVTDPETGETTTREVVATITTEDDKHFVDLTITTKDGPATLTATTTHPFWSPSEDQWVNAEDLTPGMTLHTPGGNTVPLTATHHYTQHQTTHDLTINTTHTYYVLANQTPVLVHNTNCAVPISKGRWDHIWDRHVNRSNPKYAHKSKFNTTNKSKIKKMINRALGDNKDDGVYVYKFPHAIGRNGNGEDQFRIRVVVRNHKLITAFPSD